MGAVGFIILVGILDANIKGRIMARFDWKDVPDFWKHGKGKFEIILGSISIVIALLIAFATWDAWFDRILFLFSCLILGLVGFESLTYWWLLKPFAIKQKAHWKDDQPPIGWFEFPPIAPWLDWIIIPLRFSKLMDKKSKHTTRAGIYFGCFCGLLLVIILNR